MQAAEAQSEGSLTYGLTVGMGQRKARNLGKVRKRRGLGVFWYNPHTAHTPQKSIKLKSSTVKGTASLHTGMG